MEQERHMARVHRCKAFVKDTRHEIIPVKYYYIMKKIPKLPIVLVIVCVITCVKHNYTVM